MNNLDVAKKINEWRKVADEATQLALGLVARNAKLEAIAEQAAKVRKLQNDYFRGRSPLVLGLAKSAEAQLDRLLAELDATPPAQATLPLSKPEVPHG